MLWATALTLAACIAATPGAAHGHGLDMDTASVMVDGMEITFTVEMAAPSDGDRRITITAADDEGMALKEAAFELEITGNGQTILLDSFVAPDGILEIDASPGSAAGVVSGEESGTGAWLAGKGRPVKVTDPAFEGGGLYTFEIRMGGSTGRADVSVTNTVRFVRYDAGGQDVTFEVKSYFDGVSGLEYDHTARMVTLEMPFDWGKKTILHVPVVHIEVHFPKDFAEFVANSYTGTANGVGLFRSSVTIDDYTQNDERIVHLVLLTDHLRTIERQLKSEDAASGVMSITLTASDENQFPMRAYTVDEEFYVDLTWEPPEVEPGTETSFIFTIRDGATGEPLRRSTYDFVVVQGGEEIHRTNGEAAVGGDFERFTFEEGQTGPTIIRFEDIRKTGAETEFGLVVVPEFGAAIPALAMAAAAAAAAGRSNRLRRVWG